MNQTVLITGASGGIGLELAKIFASKGYNLVLVARNLKKLNALKLELEKDFNATVLNISQDLSVPNSSQALFNEVTKHNIVVNCLVNNAGVGVFGKHINTKLEDEQKMIQLNITSLVELTKLFLPSMINKKAGNILNVASVAAFMPGPQMSVYFASKSFVLNYSEALRFELKKYNIGVTTLCPGGTNTNFFDTSKMKLNKLVDLADPRTVAMYGYNSMRGKKGVAIYGLLNNLMAFSVRFTPRNLVLTITEKISSNF